MVEDNIGFGNDSMNSVDLSICYARCPFHVLH